MKRKYHILNLAYRFRSKFSFWKEYQVNIEIRIRKYELSPIIILDIWLEEFFPQHFPLHLTPRSHKYYRWLSTCHFRWMSKSEMAFDSPRNDSGAQKTRPKYYIPYLTLCIHFYIHIYYIYKQKPRSKTIIFLLTYVLGKIGENSPQSNFPRLLCVIEQFVRTSTRDIYIIIIGFIYNEISAIFIQRFCQCSSISIFFE